MLTISRVIAAHFTTYQKGRHLLNAIPAIRSGRLGPARLMTHFHKSRTSSWRRNSSGCLVHHYLSDISLTEYNQHCLYSVCRLALCSTCYWCKSPKCQRRYFGLEQGAFLPTLTLTLWVGLNSHMCYHLVLWKQGKLNTNGASTHIYIVCFMVFIEKNRSGIIGDSICNTA